MEEKELEILYKDNPPQTIVSDIGCLRPSLELFLEAQREGRLAGTWGKKMYLSKVEGTYQAIYSVYWESRRKGKKIHYGHALSRADTQDNRERGGRR